MTGSNPSAAPVSESDVLRLMRTLRPNDPESIAAFGGEALASAEEASAQAIRALAASRSDTSEAVTRALSEAMSRFDPSLLAHERARRRPPFFRARRAEERTPEACDALVKEVDRACVRMRVYRQELARDNRALGAIQDACGEAGRKLEAALCAARRAQAELARYLSAHPAPTGAQNVRPLDRAPEALKARTCRLEAAQATLYQSAAMVKVVHAANAELIAQIDVALLVALTSFKQALTEALLIKRRTLQAQAVERAHARAASALQANKRALETEGRRAQNALSQPDGLEAAWRSVEATLLKAKDLEAEAQRRTREQRARLEALERASAIHGHVSTLNDLT